MFKTSNLTILLLPTLRIPKMLNRAMRRILRQFWLRHRPVWQHIYESDESFWIDLEDTGREVQEALWTTEGAIVRELPASRDSATQAEPSPTVDAATQTESFEEAETLDATRARDPREPEPTRTGERRSPEPSGNMSRGERNGTGPAKTGHRRLRSPNGCWNCLSDSHPYAQCPIPRTGKYCYGCGEREVTVRTCRYCGPAYRSTTPYTGPRGPRDRESLRRARREAIRTAEATEGWGWKPRAQQTAPGRGDTGDDTARPAASTATRPL